MTPRPLPREVHGEGEHTVLALHGWFTDRGAFRSMWPYLDLRRFSYAFCDYRGYGEARGVPGEHTMAEIAEDVLATADDLGWPSFSLIGHSMGGKAAQAVLAAAPGRVRKIVGISPVPASAMPFDADSWRLFASAPDDPASRRAIIDVTTGNRLTPTWIDAMVDVSLARSDVDAFRDYLTAWAKEDFHDQVVGADVPILVVVGEHDPAISEAAVRGTFGQWFPDVDIRVLPGVGHYAPDEAPIALTSLIEGFLAR